ncbi:MAG TPA: ABC transporter substrate-binding protein [Chloroflexota bacterium]|nr:ABC transporter substrate-binding protein [Chloroflexota bacterium]
MDQRLRPALLLGMLLAACTGGAGGSTASERSAPPVPAAPAAPPASAPAARAAPAAPEPLAQTVTVAYPSIAGSFLPLWLAADEGLFARYGLDVDITYIASGTTSMQSLIAGDVQFVLTSAAEPVAAYAAGAPVQIVLGWSPTPSAIFVVDPRITSPEQLRGETLGITRFGAQPHVAARLALQKWGLDPETDVQYLQLGGTPQIVAAMQSGVVVGGALAPPTNVRARQLGFRELGDVGQMGVAYQGNGVVGLQPYVDGNPEVVRRLVRALLEGIKLSLTDDAAARATLARYTRLEDPELLDETIAHYRPVTQRDGYPSPQGLQAIINDLAETDPRARTLQPAQLVNLAALQQVEAEGFLRQLYGE